jgi:hypothetical protein
MPFVLRLVTTLRQSKTSVAALPLQIQRPINRLRKAATAIAASLALVHLGMFVLIYTLLNQQTALVSHFTVLSVMQQGHTANGSLFLPARNNAEARTTGA